MIATVTPCMRRGSVSGRPAQAKDREPEPHLEHNARAHERLRQVRVALRATGVRARQCCRVPAKKRLHRRTFLKATRPATSTPAVATAPTRTSGLRALRAGNISSSTAMVRGLYSRVFREVGARFESYHRSKRKVLYQISWLCAKAKRSHVFQGTAPNERGPVLRQKQCLTHRRATNSVTFGTCADSKPLAAPARAPLFSETKRPQA